jgi:hypothetical protein
MSRDGAATAFRVDATDAAGVRILDLHGVIDEHADLGFFAALAGSVRVSLRHVRRFNSYGVRTWIDAVRNVPEGVELEFVECPPPVVDQMNMVSGFIGRGKVSSFYAPMTCEDCGVEEDRLFTVADCRQQGGKLPPVDCPECGKPMEVDDIEDQYLLFVKEA